MSVWKRKLTATLRYALAFLLHGLALRSFWLGIIFSLCFSEPSADWERGKGRRSLWTRLWCRPSMIPILRYALAFLLHELALRSLWLDIIFNLCFSVKALYRWFSRRPCWWTETIEIVCIKIEFYSQRMKISLFCPPTWPPWKPSIGTKRGWTLALKLFRENSDLWEISRLAHHLNYPVQVPETTKTGNAKPLVIYKFGTKVTF